MALLSSFHSMFRLRPLTRLPAAPHARSLYSEASFQHTTRKKHELDIQSAASKSAMRERAAAENVGDRGGEKVDPKKDHPKAPTPVIGMQDERGQTGSTAFTPRERVEEGLIVICSRELVGRSASMMGGFYFLHVDSKYISPWTRISTSMRGQP